MWCYTGLYRGVKGKVSMNECLNWKKENLNVLLRCH